MAKIFGAGGKALGEEATPAPFASTDVGSHTIYRAVYRELANPRAGTASTKRRDEVSGGGRKPWKQKGTGRARQGSTRSPQWRHGGIVFGPKPRSYITSLNRKERRAAFIAALADRFAGDAVQYLDVNGLSVAKTRDFAATIFGGRRLGDRAEQTLVVFAPSEANAIGRELTLGGRNLPRVRVASADAVDVFDVVVSKRVILTRSAAEFLTALGSEHA